MTDSNDDDRLFLTGHLRSRREVLVGATAGLAAFLGGWPPRGVFPFGLPQARAEGAAAAPLVVPGKDPGLVVLNDRPLNMETPAHLLDDDLTPQSRFFVRNNGRAPDKVDEATWTLTVDGEAVPAPKTFGLAELKKAFKHHTYALTLECGGNGRAEFVPGAKGNQWTTGAVGCASYTGVRLKDVLRAAGVQKSAVYVGYYGADAHLSGDPKKVVISRGVPIAKAMEDETLLAFAMNGEPLPLLHGAPLRLVVGGWPASVSGKWLTRLSVRDRVHDGEKMGGQSYRVPCKPVAPGEAIPDEGMCIIESMPVRSVITSPRSGAVASAQKPLTVRGHAWAGDLKVASVEVSIDFGATWQRTRLSAPPNRLAWQRFEHTLSLPSEGYFEVWARATDEKGVSQPMVVPGWNPRGYLNNACHRIAVRAVA